MYPCTPLFHASRVRTLVCMLCIQRSLLISTETRHGRLRIFFLHSSLQADAPTQSPPRQPRLLSRYVPLTGFVLWGPREGVIPQMNFSSHLSSPLKNLFVCLRQPPAVCALQTCAIYPSCALILGYDLKVMDIGLK